MSPRNFAWIVLAGCVACSSSNGGGGGNGGGGIDNSDAGGGANPAPHPAPAPPGATPPPPADAGAAPNATPPADVCALVSLADVQAILADAQAGVVDPDLTQDSADGFVRACSFKSVGFPATKIDLVVYGAKSQKGLDMIDLAVTKAPGNGTKTPVSGVGDKATFWTDDGINTLGLIAKKGDYGVDVTAYFVDPAPTQDQLSPLVKKALDAL
jgi:hypothetical protein